MNFSADLIRCRKQKKKNAASEHEKHNFCSFLCNHVSINQTGTETPYKVEKQVVFSKHKSTTFYFVCNTFLFFPFDSFDDVEPIRNA